MKLSTEESAELIAKLEARFQKNEALAKSIDFNEVVKRLNAKPEKLWSLAAMERTGGEPALVGFDKKCGDYLFFDCVIESPAGRRSLCYDRVALDSRKANKPVGSAEEMASEMGIELLDEEQYRRLQQLGNVDTKTSSWIKTPDTIRKLGGALFCDCRYDTVFVYHNGAESYYAARGFRASLRL
ncbi:MAG: DUF4256 domain-containing protein [Chitinophagaceae bacterium]